MLVSARRRRSVDEAAYMRNGFDMCAGYISGLPEIAGSIAHGWRCAQVRADIQQCEG